MPSPGMCHGLSVSIRTTVCLQWDSILLHSGLRLDLTSGLLALSSLREMLPVSPHNTLHSISHNEVACFLLYVPNECNREKGPYNIHHGVSGPDTEPGTLWANTYSINELQVYPL